MTERPRFVVVVEDSDDDFFAFERACRKLRPDLRLQRCRDVAEARALIAGLRATPGLMSWPLLFLDLNLPGVDGRHFLQELKARDNLPELPVIVYSTSGHVEDIRYCLQHHANAYHIKPLRYEEMKEQLRAILSYWMETASPSEVRP